MALTVAPVSAVPGPQYSQGILRSQTFDITFDSSYLTGGELLDQTAVLGMPNVVTYFAEMGVTTTATTAITVHFKPGTGTTTGKLLAYWGNGGSASVIPEVTSTTDLSTFTVRVTFFGF